MEILVIDAGSKDLERKLEGKRLTRINLENLKKGDPDICLTIFRPLYKDGKYIGWDEARKQFGDTKNIFMDLWQHIKNSPDDPVESITIPTFGEHGDDELDFISIIQRSLQEVPQGIQEKIKILTCYCTHSEKDPKGGWHGDTSMHLDKSPFSVNRISCKDYMAKDRILDYLSGSQRSTDGWGRQYRIYHHPFFIDC